MGAVWLGNAVRQGAAGVVRGVTDGVWGPVLDEGLVPAVAAVVGRPGSDAAESVGLVRIRIWGHVNQRKEESRFTSAWGQGRF